MSLRTRPIRPVIRPRRSGAVHHGRGWGVGSVVVASAGMSATRARKAGERQGKYSRGAFPPYTGCHRRLLRADSGPSLTRPGDKVAPLTDLPSRCKSGKARPAATFEPLTPTSKYRITEPFALRSASGV